MKKYFIVKDEALEKQYEAAMVNEDIMLQAFKQMKEEYGIETHEFYLSRERFTLVYNRADREKFKGQITQSGDFRKTSPMNKRWLELLKEKGITKVGKPILGFIIQCSAGRQRSQLFKIDGVLYGTFEAESVTLPDAWVEIKASEYYKILEDYDAKIKESDDETK